MRIMRFCGGMANNMFQYAAYLQIKKMFPKEEVYIDTMWFDYTRYPYDLEKAFNIDVSSYDFWEKAKNEAKLDYESEINKYRYWEELGYHSWIEMMDDNYHLLDGVSETELPKLYQKAGYDFKIALNSGYSLEEMYNIIKQGETDLKSYRRSLKKFLYKILGEYNFLFVLERAIRLPDKRHKLLDDIKNIRKPDFTGYPEKERFCIEGDVFYCTYGNPNDVIGVEKEIRKVFSFVPFIEDNNILLAQEIVSGNSVSIHARISCLEYGINASLHRNYYKKAVKYIEKNLGKDVTYYIFSDRPQWVRENIQLLGMKHDSNYVVVDNNSGEKAWRDMQLMSLCKHNICAQSTFSWWAAFLNNNPDKIVVTPYETMPGTISF